MKTRVKERDRADGGGGKGEKVTLGTSLSSCGISPSASSTSSSLTSGITPIQSLSAVALFDCFMDPPFEEPPCAASLEADLDDKALDLREIWRRG